MVINLKDILFNLNFFIKKVVAKVVNDSLKVVKNPLLKVGDFIRKEVKNENINLKNKNLGIRKKIINIF